MPPEAGVGYVNMLISMCTGVVWCGVVHILYKYYYVHEWCGVRPTSPDHLTPLSPTTVMIVMATTLINRYNNYRTGGFIII